jgi:hypothetical protein
VVLQVIVESPGGVTTLKIWVNRSNWPCAVERNKQLSQFTCNIYIPLAVLRQSEPLARETSGQKTLKQRWNGWCGNDVENKTSIYRRYFDINISMLKWCQMGWQRLDQVGTPPEAQVEMETWKLKLRLRYSSPWSVCHSSWSGWKCTPLRLSCFSKAIIPPYQNLTSKVHDMQRLIRTVSLLKYFKLLIPVSPMQVPILKDLKTVLRTNVWWSRRYFKNNDLCHFVIIFGG